MADPRHEKFAKVIVNYSLGIRPRDKFVIGGSVEAAPLIRAVYREALRAGAYPTVRVQLDGLPDIFYREANDDQLSTTSELAKFEINYWDAYLAIGSPYNTKQLARVDPARIQKNQLANQPISARMMERSAADELHWLVTQFPTNASAQDAGMSLSDYEDFVFSAMALHLDDPVAYWQQVSKDQQHIVDYLSKHDEIHIVAPGTDITYRVGGRKWISASGDKNLPDGEVFTGPIEDSVNGKVTFSYPAVYYANEVENVCLTFENGRVVEETAGKGLDFLKSTLNADPGARILGEVAFGLNYNIQQFSKNVLFDEKIGGTMHMALGMSYPETGGVNKSAIHWDIVCDLREGKVFADGELCYEKGKFVI